MARGGWLNPPPVMVVSGTHEFLRHREVQKARRAACIKGRRVDRIDAKEDFSPVPMALMGMSLFSDPCLIIVDHPNFVDAEMVLKHHASGDSEVALVLHHVGVPRDGSTLGRIIKKLPKKCHISYKSPKPWEKESEAISFAIRESKSRGKTLSKNLASSLVRAVGPDLGKISFEILKVCTYIDALGESGEIEPRHFKETLARLREADWDPLVNAVARANARVALKQMDEIRRNVSTDPLLKTTAWLGNQVVLWIQVASLLEKGLSGKDLPEHIGMNPYAFDKRGLLPVVKRWGLRDLVLLLDGLVSCERAVRSGHISPWIQLECVLLARCRAVRQRG